MFSSHARASAVTVRGEGLGSLPQAAQSEGEIRLPQLYALSLTSDRARAFRGSCPATGGPAALVNVRGFLRECASDIERCPGARRIDLLGDGIDLSAEWRVFGDLVAVAVGSHYSHGAPPGGQLPGVGGLWSQLRGPRRRVVECTEEDDVGSRLDEVTAFVERLPHVTVHGSGDFRDKTSNQPWSLAGAS